MDKLQQLEKLGNDDDYDDKQQLITECPFNS